MFRPGEDAELDNIRGIDFFSIYGVFHILAICGGATL